MWNTSAGHAADRLRRLAPWCTIKTDQFDGRPGSGCATANYLILAGTNDLTLPRVAGSSMSPEKPSPQTHAHQSPAADLWRRTVARIPTLFGRLVYLASLRNQNSGYYEHHGFAQMFGDEQTDHTLRHSHAQVFEDWLSLNLEQQKADLQEYLADLTGKPAAVLGTWLDLAPYRNLIPASVQDVERQLYLADLQTLLILLRHEYAGASPDSES
jgi:hypothetical protein